MRSTFVDEYKLENPVSAYLQAFVLVVEISVDFYSSPEEPPFPSNRLNSTTDISVRASVRRHSCSHLASHLLRLLFLPTVQLFPPRFRSNLRILVLEFLASLYGNQININNFLLTSSLSHHHSHFDF